MAKIKYDSILNKYPYFKFVLNEDNSFSFDTNILVINNDKNNEDNKKLFFIIDEDYSKIYPYMYYSNGYKFRNSVSDFEGINISNNISLFIPQYNIIKKVNIKLITLMFFGFDITPPVESNDSLMFFGFDITPPVESNDSLMFFGDEVI